MGGVVVAGLVVEDLVAVRRRRFGVSQMDFW